MVSIVDPNVKIFADGADLVGVRRALPRPADRRVHDQPDSHATGRRDRLRDVRPRRRSRPSTVASVSFEVLSDDFDEMERQALKLASWGPNVYVKIP